MPGEGGLGPLLPLAAVRNWTVAIVGRVNSALQARGGGWQVHRDDGQVGAILVSWRCQEWSSSGGSLRSLSATQSHTVDGYGRLFRASGGVAAGIRGSGQPKVNFSMGAEPSFHEDTERDSGIASMRLRRAGMPMGSRASSGTIATGHCCDWRMPAISVSSLCARR